MKLSVVQIAWLLLRCVPRRDFSYNGSMCGSPPLRELVVACDILCFRRSDNQDLSLYFDFISLFYVLFFQFTNGPTSFIALSVILYTLSPCI
jgi:hypothetical protein